MEDIIGIELEDYDKRKFGLITWGRVFDTGSPEQWFYILVDKYLRKEKFCNLRKIELCYSLNQIKDNPFFYEALFLISQERLPVSYAAYEVWKKKKQRKLKRGQEIYNLVRLTKRYNPPYIIAIRVYDVVRGDAAFITWGKLFDRWGYNALLDVVKQQLHVFGIRDPLELSVCDSLQEISPYPYFYEAFSSVLNEHMPLARDKHRYACWAGQKRKLMSTGKDIFFAGFKNTQEGLAADQHIILNLPKNVEIKEHGHLAVTPEGHIAHGK